MRYPGSHPAQKRGHRRVCSSRRRSAARVEGAQDPAGGMPRPPASPPSMRTGKGVQQRELDVVREGQPQLQHLVPQLNRLCQLASPPAGADDVAVCSLLHMGWGGGTRRAGRHTGSSRSTEVWCQPAESSCLRPQAPRRHQKGPQLPLPPPSRLTLGCRPRRFISSKKCIASPSLRFFMHANRPARGRAGEVGGKGGEAGRQAGGQAGPWDGQIQDTQERWHTRAGMQPLPPLADAARRPLRCGRPPPAAAARSRRH